MKIGEKKSGSLKTIALDIGNVCLKIYPERCFETLGLHLSEIPQKLTTTITKMENGTITEQEWLQTFHHLTEYKFSDNELRKAYTDILGEEIECISNFIRNAVAKNIRIIFFSDTSPIHINHIYRNLSFANLISGAIFSFEVGKHKPDSQMYTTYEQNYGKPILYIDDKLENINAGQKAGWNSILFNSQNHKKLKHLDKKLRQYRATRGNMEMHTL